MSPGRRGAPKYTGETGLAMVVRYAARATIWGSPAGVEFGLSIVLLMIAAVVADYLVE
jgi:hypothetical protein